MGDLGFELVAHHECLQKCFQMTARRKQPLLRMFYTITSDGVPTEVQGLTWTPVAFRRVDWTLTASLEQGAKLQL